MDILNAAVDILNVAFPVAGIKINVLIPPLVSFVISFFCSMGGISGAFLLLPFQVSVLGFTNISVSSTNFLYNIIGIPGGVWRYIKEDRMLWPLTCIVAVGTIPGVLLGYYIRVRFLLDARNFKLFVGLVLMYVGIKLVKSAAAAAATAQKSAVENLKIENVRFGLARTSFDFRGDGVSFNNLPMFWFALVVGVIGGVYGIGGGAIIAPFCVTVFRLPVYTVAGAALMGTFIASFFGVIFYSLVPLGGVTAPPDMMLGLLFGLGGLAGMYLGAKSQRYIPERVIKIMLGVIIIGVSAKYIYQFVK
jgi:hypothetical protein